MSIKGKSFVVGAYEHPTRNAVGYTTPQLHAEVTKGALEDAGLSKDDIDGYFCAGDAPGMGAMSMADYMGLKLKWMDSTETGGSSYILHVNHAARAIAEGKCNVALITLAGIQRAMGANMMKLMAGQRPPAGGGRGGPAGGRPPAAMMGGGAPESAFEGPYGGSTHNLYGMCATRHMYEYGTTSEQLAWIKVAASHHAQYNAHAMLREVVTVEEVLNSPMIADRRCIASIAASCHDGGGAVILARPEIAKSLKRPMVTVTGGGESPKGPARRQGPRSDLHRRGVVRSASRLRKPASSRPTSNTPRSTIASPSPCCMQLEDLGFCKKGEGGKFVADGNLISGVGKLPFNTDGGGLCNNHPTSRGGITKVIEAVRQLRGEAHPKVQVKNCDLAIAHGTGGSLGTRHGAATVIMERV